RDDLGDKAYIPLKLIHINKCPFIAIEKTLLPENAQRLGIDRQACLANLEVLKANKQLVQVISEVFEQQKEFDNKGNVDAMIYDGFFSFEDKKAFEKIRKTAPDKLATLKLTVSDKRFKELFFRYRARNFPETLSTDEQQQWIKLCQTVLSALKEDYFSELDCLLEEHRDNEKNSRILNSLYQYAEKLIEKY
ncbi:MAG: exodeoxyribonuclease I, partial [Methylococcales bacterium]|nr:exodeoxyribonuclease I [Methylococcales bacterium]